MLGRYGDPLNPWADIIAVAQAWCATAKDAKLAVGVPTMVSRKADINAFNAHRIYGPVMLSHLFANWDQVWSKVQDMSQLPIPKDKYDVYQPLFVLQRPLDHT